jgi:uncharacterized membrane protein
LTLLFSLKLVAGHGSLTGLILYFLVSTCDLHNQIYGVPSSIDFVACSLEIGVQFYILAQFLAAILLFASGSLYRRSVLVLAVLPSLIGIVNLLAR